MGSFLHSIRSDSKYIIISSALYVKILNLHTLESVGTVLDLGLSSGDRDIAIIQHTSLYSSPGSNPKSLGHGCNGDGEINAFDLGRLLLLMNLICIVYSRENIMRRVSPHIFSVSPHIFNKFKSVSVRT